jgi:hypothetical protein
MNALVAQRPDINGHGIEIRTRKLDAAHGRHQAPIIFGICHAVGNRARDRGKTAISPKPFAAREVRRQRRSFGVRTVTAFASSATFLAVEHTRTARSSSAVAPGGIGNEATSASAPASGWVPSGGNTFATAAAGSTRAAGADSMPVVVVAP